MNHRYRSFISIAGACLALIILASGISLRGVSGANDNHQITQTGASASDSRAVRIINTNLEHGQRGDVTITLDAQGNENALSFSLNFDPAQLQFVSAAAGRGVTGALLNVNSSQAASGRVGLALALPAGQVIAAGMRSIMVVTFDAPSSGNAASTRISFGDQPLRREISDARANLLPADYFPGVVTFTPSAPSTPEREPNETPTQANLLTIPGSRTGSAAVGDASNIIILYENGDRDGIEDLFFFDLTNSAQVRLTLTAANKSANLDLFLLSISGIRVTVIKLSNGPGPDERLVSPTLAPGRYYVGVSASRGSSAYTLTATQVGDTPCIATVPSDRWRGEYFNNKDLNGAPAMVRDDGNGFLNFNFGTGSPNPACGIGADNFSVRWTRTVNFTAGVHRFTVTADDGVRLYVDDVLRLDKWIDQEATTYTVDVSLTAGNHSIKMEYYENTGFTAAQLSWESLSSCVGAVPPGNWRGEYFNNKDLNGAPAMVRDDGNGFLNFNFGTGSPNPACGIGVDNFSVRWTRTVNFTAGVHRFTVTADDGVRLYVDDVLRLDKWIDQEAATYTVDVSLTAGNHSIKMEYYENTGFTAAQLSWELLPCVAIVAPSNWKGEYFNNKAISGAPAMVRDDGAGFIDFNFGSGSPSPACGIGADNFSARWTRTVNFSSAGNYRFTVTADDGVRLFVDNQLLLDKWFDQPATTYPVDVSLTAGNHTLRLEHFENSGLAVAKLSWSLLSVLAANQSTATQCAEEDNVNIPLTGQIASFIIEATHPTHPVPPDNCAPDFSNCQPALSGFSFTPGVFKLFDDGETVVEAVREASWWRPSGMAAAVDDRPQTPDAHYVRIYRRIADTSEYPQVLVLYQDGNLRLIPQPPAGASSVCFGSSVIIGPAATAQRPIAEIVSITYVSQSQSLEIKYRDGGSATIILRDVNRDLTRVQVNVNYPTGALPFATFRSMFVADGNADVDYVKWVDAAGVTRNDPIRTFPGGEGTEWFFDRQIRSRHNTSAPGLRIRIE